MARFVCVSLLFLLVLSGCKWRVIDGDSVELTVYDAVPKVQYRLDGIDAPEKHQECRTWGKTWDCGRAAAAALETRIEGMVCSGNETDRYGRVVGTCYQNGENLNAWMVLQGWALAYTEYSDAYADEEADAKAAKRGIHRGQFIIPADWRKGDRLEGDDTFAASYIGSDDESVEALAEALLWGSLPWMEFDGVLLEYSVYGMDDGGAVAFGDWRETTPTGTGRVVWRGRTYAADTTGEVSAGTAVVDIDDLAAPDVDVVLTGLPRDFTWMNTPITEPGTFEASDESMWGGFFGPQQEEVGGVFEKDGWTGAFGGSKD